MKIEITLHQETITETGRVIPHGAYSAEYNALSNNAEPSLDLGQENYDAVRLNQRMIGRAVDDAFENGSGMVLFGNGSFKGKTCSIKLFKKLS